MYSTDELCILFTSKCCIVGFTKCKKMGCKIPCYYLSSIYKDVRSKQSECVNSWRGKQRVKFIVFITAIYQLLPFRNTKNPPMYCTLKTTAHIGDGISYKTAATLRCPHTPDVCPIFHRSTQPLCKEPASQGPAAMHIPSEGQLPLLLPNFCPCSLNRSDRGKFFTQ